MSYYILTISNSMWSHIELGFESKEIVDQVCDLLKKSDIVTQKDNKSYNKAIVRDKTSLELSVKVIHSPKIIDESIDHDFEKKINQTTVIPITEEIPVRPEVTD